MEPYSPDVEWMVIIGLVISFVLAFGIGANDVANSFGTSVGSGTLTLTQACILATIFENAGAILIGQKVADTVRKGIVDVTIYDGAEKELMLGCVAALASSAIFLLGSTFLNLPVSSTQSIIGSTVGFSLVARGTRGLGWPILVKTFISWIISPVLSGCVSILFFLAIYKFILVQRNPLRAGLRSLPIFYGITVFVNVYSILLNGPKIFELDRISFMMVTFVSISIALGAALAVWLYIVPFKRDQILKDIILESLNERVRAKKSARKAEGKPSLINTRRTFNPINYFMRKSTMQNSENNRQPSVIPPKLLVVDNDKPESSGGATTTVSVAAPSVSIQTKPDTGGLEDEERIKQRKIACKKAETIYMLFMSLQNLSACFASFTHGANDVTNAIAPLISLYEIYVDGNSMQEEEAPVLLLLYGGFGISIGLWIWGRRVIQTLGHNLTKITPVTGFTVSFCSAFVVLVASDLGIPISTTHCISGSIVAVGLINGKLAKNENNATGCMTAEDYKIHWGLFRSMAYAWFLTLPVTAIVSAGIMYCFENYVL